MAGVSICKRTAPLVTSGGAVSVFNITEKSTSILISILVLAKYIARDGGATIIRDLVYG
jgi:hypothetical protein